MDRNRVHELREYAVCNGLFVHKTVDDGIIVSNLNDPEDTLFLMQDESILIPLAYCKESVLALEEPSESFKDKVLNFFNNMKGVFKNEK